MIGPISIISSMRFIACAAVITSFAFLSGLTGQGTSQDPDPKHPDPSALLKDRCGGCHGAQGAAAMLNLTTDLDTLAAAPQVVRGHPKDSALYKRLADGSMPKGGTKL